MSVHTKNGTPICTYRRRQNPSVERGRVIWEYVNKKAARKKKAVRLKCRSMTKAHAVVLPAWTFHSNECWSTTAQQAMTRNESNWLM